jgi:hypothetical protein
MEPVNDEFPMLNTKFDSLVNENKYRMDSNDFQEDKVYYIIDMKTWDKKNRNNPHNIIKVVYTKADNNEFELKEFDTCNAIGFYGGPKWVDAVSSWWPQNVPCKTGGKRKSRSQKRKKTRSQKTRRIRKKTTKKRH